MRWAWGVVLCLGIVLAAGVAYACPAHAPCGDRYGPERAYINPPYPEGEPREAYRDPSPFPGPDRTVDGDEDADFQASPSYTELAVWREPDGGLYMYGHRAAPGCRCR